MQDVQRRERVHTNLHRAARRGEEARGDRGLHRRRGEHVQRRAASGRGLASCDRLTAGRRLVTAGRRRAAAGRLAANRRLVVSPGQLRGFEACGIARVPNVLVNRLGGVGDADCRLADGDARVDDASNGADGAEDLADAGRAAHGRQRNDAGAPRRQRGRAGAGKEHGELVRDGDDFRKERQNRAQRQPERVRFRERRDRCAGGAADGEARVQRDGEEEGAERPEPGVKARAAHGSRVQPELDDAARAREQRERRPPLQPVRRPQQRLLRRRVDGRGKRRARRGLL
mmetsp:Transcript_11037/g.38333  ORF Transcript_11037/g.38333 Transcript_11037/m.38333 type:complete len:286 (+) Transcript_11037:478-1335(+)